MKSHSNEIKDYEQILRLIAEQSSLNHEYALELLEVTYRQILLKKFRALRDSNDNKSDKINYGKQACFYSEGDPDDLKILADIYKKINDAAQEIAYMQLASTR